MLPAGASADSTKLVVRRLDVSSENTLQNRILAVLIPSDIERLKKLDTTQILAKEEFSDMIVKSFCRVLLHVKKFDSISNRLFVNSITSEKLPSNYLLVGSIKYKPEK